ncbi:MAG: GAF domain-containing protein, partial [Deltaproteobacteria bacterium]|nr:GAF domain-containing protein [Deltaproteobacteria bacterium]
MDSIDALGPQPDRHAAFTRELLAEAEDDELKAIVEQAARDLKAPIALVNLVLEHIQFFKAHHGLPPDLAASRATERSVSFCQFVVRDGQPFEVTNAERDSRVPQHLVKAYGIKSYLGVPVVVDGVVLGALCVIDTKPREFSKAEREMLTKLSRVVNERLATLSKKREQSSALLVFQAAFPALAELRDALKPIQTGTASGQMAAVALASFFRLAQHVLSGGFAPQETVKRSLKSATEA